MSDPEAQGARGRMYDPARLVGRSVRASRKKGVKKGRGSQDRRGISGGRGRTRGRTDGGGGRGCDGRARK